MYSFRYAISEIFTHYSTERRKETTFGSKKYKLLYISIVMEIVQFPNKLSEMYGKRTFKNKLFVPER